MSKKSGIFMRHAKGYDLDFSRGLYGEWLNVETRRAWYLWYSGWCGHAYETAKRRRAKKEKQCQ